MSTVIIRPQTAPPHVTPVRTALFLGCGIALLLVMFLIAKGNPGHRLAAPAAFMSYLSPDKSFTCDAPMGWTTDDSGVEGSQETRVLFQQDVAKIEITADQGAGAMADVIAQNGQNGVQTMPGGLQMAPISAPVPAVEQVHRMALTQFELQYSDYAEQPIHAFQSQLGVACLSEWTGTGRTSGTHLHGYRVTMLGRDKRICLNCRCAEGDWKTLQPTFVRVIHSVAQGPG